METTAKRKTKKKGLFAAIWESMTRTGGCCGGDCCGGSKDTTSMKDKSGQKPAGVLSPRG